MGRTTRTRRAGLLAGIAALVVGAACSSGGHGPSGGSQGSRAATAPASPSTPAVPAFVSAEIPVGALPQGEAMGFGSVWVSNHHEGTVSRIDPKTNTVTDTIHTGGGPGELATGLGGVWVNDWYSSSLFEIDPGTGRVRTVDLQASGGDTNTGCGPHVGFGAVWTSAGFEIDRVDPTSRKVIARIPTRQGYGCVETVGMGGVWFDDESGKSYRIDPATEKVTLSLPVLAPTIAGATMWAIQPDAGSRADAVRVDPTTGHLADPIPTSRESFLVAGGGRVWVVDHDDGSFREIDANTGKVLDRHRASEGLDHAVFGYGSLWVEQSAANEVLRVDPTG